MIRMKPRCPLLAAHDDDRNPKVFEKVDKLGRAPGSVLIFGRKEPGQRCPKNWVPRTRNTRAKRKLGIDNPIKPRNVA